MTTKQALRLAVICMRKQRQRYAFDANIYRRGECIDGQEYHRGKAAAEEYDKISAAIDTLNKIMEALDERP